MGVSFICLLPSPRGPALPMRARQRSSRPGQLFGLCRRKGRDDPRYSTVSERSSDHGAVGLSRPHSRFYGHAQHTRGKKKGRSVVPRPRQLRRWLMLSLMTRAVFIVTAPAALGIRSGRRNRECLACSPHTGLHRWLLLTPPSSWPSLSSATSSPLRRLLLWG